MSQLMPDIDDIGGKRSQEDFAASARTLSQITCDGVATARIEGKNGNNYSSRRAALCGKRWLAGQSAGARATDWKWSSLPGWLRR